jgi:5-histidylcysteine sulfoxide synthase/putative 4-mercaptohistidine N1-methyltranferase
LWVLFMSFEHERIHLETSSVLMREMARPMLTKPTGWAPNHPSAPAVDTFEPVRGVDYMSNPLIPVAAGQVDLGKPEAVPSFGWDNEYGAVTRSVPAFAASTTKISNGEYYEFVKQGGYRDDTHWTEDGWKWRTFRNIKWPSFWTSVGPQNLHQYKLRTIFELIPMPWSWPAEVNVHEAAAFCNWKAAQDGSPTPYRISCEGEHARIRETAIPAGVDFVTEKRGDEMEAEGLNFNLAYGTPSAPATTSQVYGSATTPPFADVMGNVWEWAADDFHPLPGFQPDPMYDDFSTPCYDGEHSMLLGGSFISTGDEASIYSRFHFRDHFFQHAGFRVVAPDATSDSAVVKLKAGLGEDKAGYESRKLLDEYMHLHYGGDTDLPQLEHAVRFPQRCAELVATWSEKLGLETNRAVDIGCSVGGSTFELAQTFDEVVGVDLSASFIDTANRMKNEGSVPYYQAGQGDLGDRRIASVDNAEEGGLVHFRRADACSLPGELMGLDAALLANLLCRLPSPKSCLGRLGGPRGIIKPGGIAVIVSPYSWLEEFTAKNIWLGGYEDKEGQPVYAQDTLTKYMDDLNFDLVHDEDMPLVIREHERKYQYINSHAMVFQRRLE